MYLFFYNACQPHLDVCLTGDFYRQVCVGRMACCVRGRSDSGTSCSTAPYTLHRILLMPHAMVHAVIAAPQKTLQPAQSLSALSAPAGADNLSNIIQAAGGGS